MAAATRKCILDSQEFSVCAIFVLERSISDYGAKVSRRISRERKKKKKEKRSVVGSEINFGAAPYLANALKSVGEPVERVIQGGAGRTTTMHRLYTTT